MLAMKILVVEDDKFLSTVFERYFIEEGLEVATALNGEEAMAKVREDKPNLIALDILLPGKDGLEILAEIKSDDELKDIPVIIVTNLGGAPARKQAMDLGAVEFIIKSNADVEDVVNIVKKYME